MTLTAPFSIYDGYGGMSVYLACGLERAGAQVNLIPLDARLAGLPEEFLRIASRSTSRVVEPVLYHGGPCHPTSFDRFEGMTRFSYTTCESSSIAPWWPEKLNGARAVLVPTRFVAKVLRAGGVAVPIEVVPQGVDPEIYHLLERTEQDGFVTLIVSTMSPRKHLREAVAAWQLAFESDPAARLIIKSKPAGSDPTIGFDLHDPRITLVVENEMSHGLTHWYAKADALMALGNEGFGLPLVEAMACGLPVVALSSEGQGDICEEVPDLVLPVSPSGWEPDGGSGVRGVPDVQECASHLRWLAAHRDEARHIGAAAAKWAVENRNVWQMGPRILDVMEQYYPAGQLRAA